MLNKKFLLLIGVVFILVSVFMIVQSILALTAESDSYSVSMFGTGVQATNLSSDNLEARSVLLASAGGEAQSSLYQGIIGFFGRLFGITPTVSYSVAINQTAIVQAGNNYSITIEAISLGGSAEITSSPKITLYDPLKNLIVSNADATLLSDKKYQYNFTTSLAHTAGEWQTNISIGINGVAKQYSSTWTLSNGHTAVSIGNVDVLSVPAINANVTITNEDSLAYEYPYKYCIVSVSTQQCGNSGNVAYASGYKLLSAGESWNTILSLNIAQSGNYWFKVEAQYGTQSSGATRSFSASYTPAGSSGTTGGTGGGSSATSNKSSSITGETIKYPEHLMDISTRILDEYKFINPGNKVLMEVSLYNLGTEEIKDAKIRYCIENSNRKTVKCSEEVVAVYTRIQLVKEFLISQDTEQGEYFIKTEATYGNETVYSETSFEVMGALAVIAPKNFMISYLLPIGLGIIILILLIIIIFKIKKKKSLKQELKQGLKFIAEGKTSEARLTYENIKKIYSSDKNAYQEMYPRIMEFYNKILKSRPLVVFVGFIGAIVLIFSLLKLNITGAVIGTGRAINNTTSYNFWVILILLIIIFVLALLIILRKKNALIYKKIIEFLSEIINKNKKYSSNSIKGLIKKKVYSENGHYMGKVRDVILGENRIENLKIKIDKKHNFRAKGIVINYKQVKSAGEVIIIDERILEHIENCKNI